MAKFKGSVLTCVQCGADFRVPPSRAATATTCSHKCAVVQRGKSIERKVQLVCKGCGGEFLVPRCHAERRVFCSRGCMEASPSIKGLKAGRTGTKNPAWVGGRYTRRDGYVYVTAPDHPFAAPSGHVLEHRLIMERWLNENEPRSPFLVEVDGNRYLSRDYHVHHKDEIKTHNSIDNLQCMTPADHRAYHSTIRKAALKFYREHFPAGSAGSKRE